MTKEQPRFLAVLPWLRLQGPKLKMGKVIFWKWPDSAGEFIPEENQPVVKEAIENSFKENRPSGGTKNLFNIEAHKVGPEDITSTDSDSEAPETVVIATIKDKDPFITLDQMDVIWEAVNALCASVIFETYMPEPLVTDDTRTRIPRYKNFTDFSLYLIQPEKDGYFTLRRRSNGRSKQGFYRGKVVKPIECTSEIDFIGLGGKLGSRETRDLYFGIASPPLIQSLHKLLKKNTELKERVVRSLEFFNRAFTDSWLVSENVEIVMVVTAFEILLELEGRSNKAETIAFEKLKELFRDRENLNKTDMLHNKEREERTEPYKCWCLYNLYKLRNSIVHGDKIEPDILYYNKEKGIKHIELAILVYRLTLMKILSKEKIHPPRKNDTEMELADNLDKLLKDKSPKKT